MRDVTFCHVARLPSACIIQKKEGSQVKESKRSKGRFVFTFEKKKVTWRRARVVEPRALSPLSPRCRASPPWRDTPVAMYGVSLVVPRFAKALVHRDFTLCLCLFAGARVKAGAPSLMRKKITGKNVCEKTSISDPFTHQRLCVPPQRGAWHVAGRDGRHDARAAGRVCERFAQSTRRRQRGDGAGAWRGW